MQTINPALWINDGRIEEAADYYCSVFPDGRVTSAAPSDEDGPFAGQPLGIQLELNGQTVELVNGTGTTFTPNESLSLAVGCDNQDELDRLWKALTHEGEGGPCGWCKDKYGFSWQVVPTELYSMLADPDREKVQRVIECFMKVDGRPLDLEELRAAFDDRAEATQLN